MTNKLLFSAKDLKNNGKEVFLGDPKSVSKEVLQKTLYTAVMSFCALNDLLKTGDQKTPGTFFELLSSHLFAKTYSVNPVREIEVLNLDMEGDLPTDYIFDLGKEKSRIHLPVKTSTGGVPVVVEMYGPALRCKKKVGLSGVTG